MRREYTRDTLNEQDLAEDPRTQFFKWYHEAEQVMLEPNAMALATSSENKPSNRMVLFREWDNGLIFYTNYNSRKGKELSANPYAAATFYWDLLERQICLEGPIEKVSTEISDLYFSSRPKNSQLSSWASEQDKPLSSREELEEKYTFYSNKFTNQPVPRPPNWGGYRLTPARIEFWQGRPYRLHDRFVYLKEQGRWVIKRLAP